MSAPLLISRLRAVPWMPLVIISFAKAEEPAARPHANTTSRPSGINRRKIKAEGQDTHQIL